MPAIRIRFSRPGAGVTEWTQDLIAETSHFILTSFSFEVDEPLVVDGKVVIASGSTGLLFEMLRENIEVIAVFDFRGSLTGYYVNLNSEPQRFEGGYDVTDWFLDLWVFPDLRYRILDEEEFYTAVRSGTLTEAEAERARETLRRVEASLAARDFPPAPVREYFLRQT